MQGYRHSHNTLHLLSWWPTRRGLPRQTEHPTPWPLMVVCIDRSFSAPFQQFEILTYISVWLVDETSGECSFSEDLPAFNTFKSSARIEAGTSLWTKVFRPSKQLSVIFVFVSVSDARLIHQQFEATYVERCKELGIMPSERFLRGLKEARCNQNACTRLNVTHGRVDDHHVQPLIEALREHHDIEEVALNFNDKLTDEVLWGEGQLKGPIRSFVVW